MIFHQTGKDDNYFNKFSENIRTGYLENYLTALNVDTVMLRKKVKARIRRLEQCLRAIDTAEARNIEENL